MGPWRKFFSHPSFSYLLFFATSPMKLKLANKWESTNSKPPGPIITIGQLETGTSSQIQFITLFYGRCTPWLPLLPALVIRANMLGQNQFPELNQHVLTFLHGILNGCRVTCWAEHCWRASPPHHTCKHPLSLNLAARESVNPAPLLYWCRFRSSHF